MDQFWSEKLTGAFISGELTMSKLFLLINVYLNELEILSLKMLFAKFVDIGLMVIILKIKIKW